MTHSLALSLGSNNPDRERQMQAAMDWIASLLHDVRVSAIHETPSDNGIGAPYLNAVATAWTDMDIDRVTSLIKQWETQCGRTPESKIMGEIPIDIDIVVWDGTTIRAREFSRPYFRKGYDELTKPRPSR